MKKTNIFFTRLHIVLFGLLYVLPACFSDELEDDELLLEEKTVITEDEVLKLIEKAYLEPNKKLKNHQLLHVLDVLIENNDLILPPRKLYIFRNKLFLSVDHNALKKRLPLLLKAKDADQFDMSAKFKINLAIQISLIVGGVSYIELQQVYNSNRIRVDLEWYLPALARAGGEKANTFINKYRSDKSIITLNHAQNIRKIPCAAVLASAYTGDDMALKKILSWYERDIIMKDRFAFSVSWARSEGHKITPSSYAVVDHCEHRINQAEALLNYISKKDFNKLIKIMNDDMSIAITDYIVRRINKYNKKTPMNVISQTMPLINNTSLQIKLSISEMVRRLNNKALHELYLLNLHKELKSSISSNRFFAFQSLLYDRKIDHKDVLLACLESESNGVMKRRMNRYYSRFFHDR